VSGRRPDTAVPSPRTRQRATAAAVLTPRVLSGSQTCGSAATPTHTACEQGSSMQHARGGGGGVVRHTGAPLKHAGHEAHSAAHTSLHSQEEGEKTPHQAKVGPRALPFEPVVLLVRRASEHWSRVHRPRAAASSRRCCNAGVRAGTARATTAAHQDGLAAQEHHVVVLELVDEQRSPRVPVRALTL
jgi:hypothetical protein